MSDEQAGASEAPERTDAPPIETQDEHQPAESHESVVRVAQAMGWSPKDKWRGKPDGWVDAETFLSQQPARLKKMGEQIETVQRTAERIVTQNAKQIEARIRAELRAATEAGDAEAVEDAADRLAEARTQSKSSELDPKAVQRDFAKRNPWFGVDDEATAIAEAAAGRIAAKGIQDPDQQLAAAERAVRKAMPELFDDEAPEDRPSRSSPSKGAPTTTGGQRTATSTPREPGWADLPSSVRATMNDKRLTNFGFTADEAGRKEYARVYWAEKKEQAR